MAGCLSSRPLLGRARPRSSRRSSNGGRSCACRSRTRPVLRGQPSFTGVNISLSQSRSFGNSAAERAFLEHAQVFDNYYGTGRGTGRGRPRGRSQRDARDRLAGGAPGARVAARVRDASSSCRPRATRSRSGCARAEPNPMRRSRGGCATRSAICRTGRNSTTSSSMTTSSRALGELTRIVDAQGEALRADRPALAPLIAELLA